MKTNIKPTVVMDVRATNKHTKNIARKQTDHTDKLDRQKKGINNLINNNKHNDNSFWFRNACVCVSLFACMLLLLLKKSSCCCCCIFSGGWFLLCSSSSSCCVVVSDFCSDFGYTVCVRRLL